MEFCNNFDVFMMCHIFLGNILHEEKVDKLLQFRLGYYPLLVSVTCNNLCNY
jgi:hypothetical protein